MGWYNGGDWSKILVGVNLKYFLRDIACGINEREALVDVTKSTWTVGGFAIPADPEPSDFVGLPVQYLGSLPVGTVPETYRGLIKKFQIAVDALSAGTFDFPLGSGEHQNTEGNAFCNPTSLDGWAGTLLSDNPYGTTWINPRYLPVEKIDTALLQLRAALDKLNTVLWWLACGEHPDFAGTYPDQVKAAYEASNNYQSVWDDACAEAWAQGARSIIDDWGVVPPFAGWTCSSIPPGPYGPETLVLFWKPVTDAYKVNAGHVVGTLLKGGFYACIRRDNYSPSEDNDIEVTCLGQTFRIADYADSAVDPYDVDSFNHVDLGTGWPASFVDNIAINLTMTPDPPVAGDLPVSSSGVPSAVMEARYFYCATDCTAELTYQTQP